MIYKKTLLLLAIAMLTVICLACSSSDDGDEAGGAAAAASTDGGAGDAAAAAEYKLAQEVDLTIEVTSTQVSRIRRIGLKYSCSKERSGIGFEYGQNLSPPLAWSGVPEGAVTLALVLEGTDNLIVLQEPPYSEPLAVHWLMWNIPADLTELPEAIATTTEVVSIGPNVRQGLNVDNKIGYTGPCPPPLGLASKVTQQGGGYNYTYGAKMRGVDDFFFRIYALDTELDLGPETTRDDLLRAIDGHIVAAGELNGKYAQRRKF
jgi:Raf kinase inhibitor-like YbhB/YbcL family protein